MRAAVLLAAAALALTSAPTPSHAISLVNFGEMWSYWPDTQGDPNVNYTRASFAPTTAWKSGKAPIGYGDTSLATFVPQGPTNMITFYTRKVVNMTGYVIGANASLLVDDGAAVYVNGVEVFRANLPLGALTRNTPATTSIGGTDEKKLLTFTIAAARFVLGNNVIAVEVHNAFKSFDMRFNMAVDYTPAPSATPSPAAMVDSVVIPRRSVWQFTENVSDAVAGWNTEAFNDGMWSYGPGPLGFGDNPTTVVNKLSNGIVAYFRRTFVVPFLDQVLLMKADILRDDGAVCYINGNEVFRSNVNPGAVLGPNTLAASSVQGTAEKTYLRVDVPRTGLTAGENTFACEVHQCAANDADLTFDLSLILSLRAEYTYPSWSVTPKPSRAAVLSRSFSAAASGATAATSSPVLVGTQSRTSSGVPSTSPKAASSADPSASPSPSDAQDVVLPSPSSSPMCPCSCTCVQGCDDPDAVYNQCHTPTRTRSLSRAASPAANIGKPKSAGSGGPNPGVVAGAVIACVAVVALVGVGVFLYKKRNSNNGVPVGARGRAKTGNTCKEATAALLCMGSPAPAAPEVTKSTTVTSALPDASKSRAGAGDDKRKAGSGHGSHRGRSVDADKSKSGDRKDKEHASRGRSKSRSEKADANGERRHHHHSRSRSKGRAEEQASALAAPAPLVPTPAIANAVAPSGPSDLKVIAPVAVVIAGESRRSHRKSKEEGDSKSSKGRSSRSKEASASASGERHHRSSSKSREGKGGEPGASTSRHRPSSKPRSGSKDRTSGSGSKEPSKHRSSSKARDVSKERSSKDRSSSDKKRSSGSKK